MSQGAKADTIEEYTADAGVTADGVKCKDSEVYTDTIHEKTAGSGVTVDSVVCKDGGVQADTLTDAAGTGAPTASEGLKVDTIDEETATNGVDIDGVKCKDDGIQADTVTDKAGTGAPDFPYGATGLGMARVESLQIEHSDLTAEATTETIDVMTAGQDLVILGCWTKVDTVFSGGAVSACAVELGEDEDPDPNHYQASTDIFTGASTGHIIGNPGVGFDGTDAVVVLSSGQKVQAKFTTTDANVSALTAGDLTVYVAFLELA